MTEFPSTFSSFYDLAKLPWFSLDDEHRLCLDADVAAEFGPIIDVHSHLAMTHFRGLQIDLHAEQPDTHYYLPLTTPLNLDQYANLHLDRWTMFAMKMDLSVMSLSSGGMRVTHTAPNLVRDLRALNIHRSIVLPIDMPRGASNARGTIEVCARYPELVSFGSVHPRHPDLESELDEQAARGAIGIKVHPNGQFIAPDHPKTLHLCRQCGSRELPMLFHCGPVGIEPKAGRRRSQVFRYEQMLADNPETRFILGHAGALQYAEGIELLKRYPNAWCDVSCLSLPALRQVLDEVPTEKIMFGTDWPFYHQSLTLAKVLIATEGNDAARRAVLGGNARHLFGSELD